MLKKKAKVLTTAIEKELTNQNYDAVYRLAKELQSSDNSCLSTFERNEVMLIVQKAMAIATTWIGDANKSLPYAVEYVRIASEDMDTSTYADACHTLGYVHQRLSQNDEALKWLEESLQCSVKLGSNKPAADTMNNIGNVRLTQSNYACALEWYLEAQRKYLELNLLPEAAASQIGIGHVYRECGRLDFALEQYFEALGVLEKSIKRTNHAICLGNIGIVYQKLGDYEKSVEYLTRSMAELDALDLQGGVAMFEGNLGITFCAAGDSIRAIKCYENAINIYGKMGLALEQALFEANLGVEMSRLGRYDEALAHLSSAYEVELRAGRHEESAGALWHIGEIYASKESQYYDIDRGIELIRKAIETYQEIGSDYYLSKAHGAFADIYKQHDMWQECAYHLEQHHQYYAKVQSAEVRRQADMLGWERKVAEQTREREQQAVILARVQRDVERMAEQATNSNQLLDGIQSRLSALRPYVEKNGIEILEQLETAVQRNISSSDLRKQVEREVDELIKTRGHDMQRRFPSLTKTELKVALLVGMGLTTTNIAAVLCVSERTVEFHRLNLRKKLKIDKHNDLKGTLFSLLNLCLIDVR